MVAYNAISQIKARENCEEIRYQLSTRWDEGVVKIMGLVTGIISGLSSHSVNGLVDKGGNDIGAVVIGRLGGLRTQRCHSALLRIRGILRGEEREGGDKETRRRREIDV